MKRLVVLIASCAVLLGAVAPGQAAAQRLTWSGFGPARLGESIAAGAGALGRPVTNACGRHLVSVGAVVLDDRVGKVGRITDIHTKARGVTGPLGVRVRMSDRALRAAFGRRSAAFTARRRHGRLLVGPKGHTAWALDASPRAHRVGEFGVSVDERTARRAAQAGPCMVTPAPTTVDSTPVPMTTTPPRCPPTLPSVGPYMHAACDESTANEVRFSCHPDWLDADQDPADGCEAEKDGLQTMWFQQWSAMSLADHITGSFSMDGYAAQGTELTTTDWGWFQGPDPIEVPVPPDCSSNPTVACPNGQPADPPPTLDLDITVHPGDSARSVIQQTGTGYPTGSEFLGAGTGYDQASAVARFRLTTTAPIPFTYSGVSCQFALDTTQGNVPDLELSATLAKAIDSQTNQGEDGPPQVSNVSIGNLEGADVRVEGNFACQSSNVPLQAFYAMIQPALTSWYEAATRLCGTAGPYWWEPCPPSVDVSW